MFSQRITAIVTGDSGSQNIETAKATQAVANAIITATQGIIKVQCGTDVQMLIHALQKAIERQTAHNTAIEKSTEMLDLKAPNQG